MINIVAWVLADPRVRARLISRAILTPYTHIDDYILRWWLVPYADPEAGEGCGPVTFKHRPVAWCFQKLGIAIRVHHILRPDYAAHPHDHPWDARTFVMSGAYIDDRTHTRADGRPVVVQHIRSAGSTATLNFGEFHHISWISQEPVFTLFVTFKYRGPWGFLVNGVKIPWREYEAKYGRVQ